MSIVEKAVDRFGSSKKDQDDRSSPAADRLRVGNSSGLIPYARPVAEGGFLSVLENPELAREFRLLKRPLFMSSRVSIS